MNEANQKVQENQKAVQYIFEMIKCGKLVEGSRLPAERVLAEEIGIARSSTREAINMLAGMGLVESRQGSGTYVTNNAAESIKQMVDVMITLGQLTNKEFVDYRRVISMAVGMALIENGMPDSYRTRFESILCKMKEASGQAFVELDREFHLNLIRATENVLFLMVMEPIGEIYLDKTLEVVRGFSREELDSIIPTHENIYRSIIEKDKELFGKSIREHYKRIIDAYNA